MVKVRGPGSASSLLVTGTATWAVAPGARGAVGGTPAFACRPSGTDEKNGTKAEGTHPALFSLRIERSNVMVVPGRIGGVWAGVRARVAGRRMQVRLAIRSAGAAMVFNQRLSMAPPRRRLEASLPNRIGPTPAAIWPVARVRATTAPLTYRRASVPSYVAATWVHTPLFLNGVVTPTDLPLFSCSASVSLLPSSASTNELAPLSRLRAMVCTPLSFSGLIQAATVNPPSKTKSGWSGE